MVKKKTPNYSNMLYLGSMNVRKVVSAMQKYLLYIGIIGVFIFSSFIRGVWQDAAFERVEKVGMAKLGVVHDVKADVFLPEVNIVGPKGGVVSVPDKGSFMLVNIWSARCKDCIENLKILKRLPMVLPRDEEKNWQIIGVSIDKPEDMEPLAQVIRKYKFKEVGGYYDVHGELRNALTLKSMPVTLIVDNHGRILYEVYGIGPWLDPDVIMFLRSLQRAGVQ